MQARAHDQARSKRVKRRAAPKRVGMMQTNKRIVGLSAFSNDSKRPCNEKATLFIASGTVVEQNGSFARILTSASLVKVHHDQTELIAFLERYDLHLEIAIVRTFSYFRDIAAVHLDHALESPPHSKVVAVGRDGDGRLMNTSGTLVSEFFSTCKFPKEWEGGALFDFEGNFLGLNLFSDMRRSIFLPRSLIHDEPSPLRTSFLERVLEFNAVRVKEPLPGEVFFFHSDAYIDVPNKDQTEEIVSLGYPKPPLNSNCDMVLVHSFEERFGDTYPVGAWNIFKDKEKLGDVYQNVVALASFKGETRFEDISAASRQKNKLKGHYSIIIYVYVALVGVNDFCHRAPPAKLKQIEIPLSSKVVAVGCLFESGVLVAAHGERTYWRGRVSCKALSHSTCKITKAGIGGPHVNVDGDFIGMNFYDDKLGTPFKSCSDLCKVLAFLKNSGTVGDKYEIPFGVRDGIAEDPEDIYACSSH
ncbi:hypothetical protein QOZ80_6AG0524230 [Eleusine coracana subsp. coracana]|nr:hypothetical protein QOZ80_6AG0524230 [Eleusine coracana subsp. coracana]